MSASRCNIFSDSTSPHPCSGAITSIRRHQATLLLVHSVNLLGGEECFKVMRRSWSGVLLFVALVGSTSSVRASSKQFRRQGKDETSNENVASPKYTKLHTTL